MSKPEPDTSYVTIPYFLYEAMARVYYGRINGDFPVTRPIAAEDPAPTFTGTFDITDDDIPPTWKPQGLAQRKNGAKSPTKST